MRDGHLVQGTVAVPEPPVFPDIQGGEAGRGFAFTDQREPLGW